VVRMDCRMERWMEDLSFCFGEPWRLLRKRREVSLRCCRVEKVGEGGGGITLS
jgi:hypothetical protein